MVKFSPAELVKRAVKRYSVARGVLASRRKRAHAGGVVTRGEARSIHEAEREQARALEVLRKRRAAAWPSGISDRGLAALAGEEGFRAFVYDDATGLPWGHGPGRSARGTATQGYGETQGLSFGMTWTREFALERMRVRVNRDYLGPVLALARELGITLRQWEKDALASLVYNTGTGILGATKAMGAAFRSRSHERIAAAFLVYDDANPGDGRLRERRLREQRVFRHGYGS